MTIRGQALFCLALLLLATYNHAAPVTECLYYTGTIGKSAVQMELLFTGTQVKGHYWYENNPVLYDARGLVRNQLEMKGTCDAKVQTKLAESPFGQKPTGLFVGAFAAQHLRFSGTWTKPDRTSGQAVVLQAVAKYTSITQTDTKRRITSTASYPLFFTKDPAARDAEAYLRADCTMKMHAFLAGCLDGGLYKGAEQGCTQGYSASIAFYSPQFISLLGEEYTDTWGVHPNTDYFTYNLVLTPDGMEVLTYDSLFQLGTEDAIGKLLASKLHAVKVARGTDDMDTTGEKFDRSIMDCVLLMPKGAVFVFPRYTVGCYAECEYFVTVPYTELTGMIANDQLSFLPKPKATAK
jgi:hypothetical protein